MSSPRAARTALLPAVLAVSTSAIFVRWAAAPPVGAAFWRGAFAGLAFLPVLLVPAVRRQFRELTLKRILLISGAVAIICLHQICFITSLNYTSVAATTFLTSTMPVWTAVLGGWIIREHVSLRSYLAVGGALVGMALIAFAKPVEGALFGNCLAVAAAILSSLYTIAARRLRQGVPIVPYMMIVHASGSVFVGLIALVFGVSLIHYSSTTWLALILLGVIPTLLGHTLLTFSVRYLKAFIINAVVLGEPVGATILAVIFLHEYPSLQTVIGAVIVLVCILRIVFERDARPTGEEM